MIGLEERPLILLLEGVAWSELDRQGLDQDGEGELYVDPVDGTIEGRPDMFKVIAKVIEAYREEGY